jgi:hypothetical protein
VLILYAVPGQPRRRLWSPAPPHGRVVEHYQTEAMPSFSSVDEDKDGYISVYPSFWDSPLWRPHGSRGGSSPPGIPRDRPPVRLGRKPRKPGMKEVIVGHDQLAGFCGSGVLVDVPFAENRRLVAAWTERP